MTCPLPAESKRIYSYKFKHAVVNLLLFQPLSWTIYQQQPFRHLCIPTQFCWLHCEVTAQKIINLCRNFTSLDFRRNISEKSSVNFHLVAHPVTRMAFCARCAFCLSLSIFTASLARLLVAFNWSMRSCSGDLGPSIS